MDAKLRSEIAKEVRAAMTEACEQYITADEVCQQFQMFTKDWINKFGDILPRKRVKVTTLKGEPRKTHWAYARHQIAINIAEGVYDNMKLLR